MKDNIHKKWSSVFMMDLPSFLVPLILLSVGPIVLRFFIWGTYSFNYLLWNILLAFIPLVLSFVASSQPKGRIIDKIIFSSCLILWLLFIPNAPYLVTDIIHLGEIKIVPVLFDSFLLFSTALLGVVIFCLSLEQVEKIILERFSKKTTSLLTTFIILLISFGVYIGRFARFNSWDIFTNHQYLIGHIWGAISEINLHVYLYTLLFFFFLFFSYQSWKFLKKKK